MSKHDEAFARSFLQTPACLSGLMLDRFVAESVSTAEKREILEHTKSCASCGGRLQARRDEMRDFAAHANVSRFVAATFERRAGAQSRPFSKWLQVTFQQINALKSAWFGAGFALAAAALLMVIQRPVDDATRVKGAPVLKVFVQHDGAVFEALAQQVVYPGDALRFGFNASVVERAKFAAVLSVDGAGQVSIYASAAGGQALSLINAELDGETRILDGSVILDGVLGSESLLAVLCPSRFDVRAIAQAVERSPLSSVAIPAGCERAAFSMTKVARP